MFSSFFRSLLVVTWPIFNGFQTEHQVEEAKATQNAIRYAIADLQQRVWLDVKTAYLELQTSVERIHQAEVTLAASSGQLELADKRYNAGLGNIIELTDAERFYIQDDAAYVATRCTDTRWQKRHSIALPAHPSSRCLINE